MGIGLDNRGTHHQGANFWGQTGGECVLLNSGETKQLQLITSEALGS